ncbi:uncharacterized protein PHACADRAFT_213522 [Phanerochaete carnosa HHB-10118-sp]|uniref:ZW10 C-terminal helical domain-containing protein n=1 Tax=Phanerochaete carnosa (strain HHB-10118-sp) TaxID=650164 RepID=K5VHB3_PHACS|nr:uncharacterized protein PHACADRAFT_213522 [Phanerochaete carnosa HHB-10118-sp]EKM50623.1 hypothetical protein PHACADRAFT_213522 [Phanerochaete carnosa HHB-10118-sp]
MAFHVPTHLPRKKDLDVSTTVLSKISETSPKALTHNLSSTWVAELDVAIRQTKDRIHERVQTDFPAFEKQLASAKSVQERLHTLTANVDGLQNALSNPQTGLVPTLVNTLTRHAALAQEAADAEAMSDALEYLARCKLEMQNLATLVEGGRLPEAVKRYRDIEHLLAQHQPSLIGADVYADLQRRFRAMKDKADEQLNEAYSRSVIVNASEIVIRRSVQVRASETVLSLPSVLSSLSSTNLSSLMTTLRRNISAHYIDFLLSQAAAVELSTVPSLSGAVEHRLSIFPAPREHENLKNRIVNVTTVLSFLDEHLFPHLPSTAAFPISLSKPLTRALLDKFLIPSLPSTLKELPVFLDVVLHAVGFEDDYIRGMLGDATGGHEVKTWAGSVGTHYEKKRRIDILERARAIIIWNEDDSSSFRAEMAVVREEQSQRDTSVPEFVPEHNNVSTSPPPRHASPEDVAWGFGDESATAVDEDGWGLDDDMDIDLDAPAEPSQPSPTAPETSEAQDDEDADGAWGLDDENSTDSSAWDDPWGNGAEPEVKPPPPKAPKAATKLEKLSQKGKTKEATPASPPPVPVSAPSPKATPLAAPPKPAAPAAQPVERETYLVSGRVRELLWLVDEVLSEAAELTASGVLHANACSSTAQVGGITSQTAPMVLDLYRGLYPVVGASRLAAPKHAMGFSNDCFWLAAEVVRLLARSDLHPNTRSKLEEAQRRSKTLADCWYDETIGRQIDSINSTLDKAEGFVGTNHQARFDECEEAVSQVLQNVRKFAQHTKNVLVKSKYYEAIGAIVDAALARILQDILALPDITEVESHKLNELCLIFNALEGLFVEDPSQPSFVVAYVPSWLKFSYLSELMEASMSDISYLFEEGALVDFDIGELVSLVRALFADTPLRANTINRLMQGHPPPVRSES